MGKGRRNRAARVAAKVGPTQPIRNTPPIGDQNSSRLLRLPSHEPQTQPVTGVCVLCDGRGELALVSVLPRWAYDHNPNYPRWYLLCADCDAALSAGETLLSVLCGGSHEAIREYGVEVTPTEDLAWVLSGDALTQAHLTLLGIAFKYDHVARQSDRMPEATRNRLRKLLNARSTGILRAPVAIRWYSFDLLGGASPRDYVGVQSDGSVNGLAPHSEVSLAGVKWMFQTDSGEWLDSLDDPVPDWTVLIGDGRANATWFSDYQAASPDVRASWANHPQGSPCPCGSVDPASECCARSWLSVVPATAPEASVFKPVQVPLGSGERLGPSVEVRRIKALPVPGTDLPAGLGSDRRTVAGVQGRCALCANETTLLLSHIHPKWSFREMKAEGSVLHMPEGATWASQMQDGYKHYLLCERCEKFLGEGENALRRVSYSTFDELSSNGLDIGLGADSEWRIVGRSRHLIQRALLGMALKYHYAPSAQFTLNSQDTAERVRTLLATDDYAGIEPPRAIKWFNLASPMDVNPRAMSWIAFGDEAAGEAQLSQMIGGMSWYTSLVPAKRIFERESDWAITIAPLRANAFIFRDWDKVAGEIDLRAQLRTWNRADPCPCGSAKKTSACCEQSWLSPLADVRR